MDTSRSNPKTTPEFTLPADAIELLGACALPSQQGDVQVVCGYIEQRSYLPDVYVQLRQPMQGPHLAADPVFLRALNEHLAALGYEGPELDRAEWGMQEDTCVVLEPSKEFRSFAKSKGWLDASEPRSPVLPRLGTPQTEVLAFEQSELEVLLWFPHSLQTPPSTSLVDLEKALDKACQALKRDVVVPVPVQLTVREDGAPAQLVCVWQLVFAHEVSTEECEQWRERLLALSGEATAPLQLVPRCTDMHLVKQMRVRVAVGLPV